MLSKIENTLLLKRNNLVFKKGLCYCHAVYIMQNAVNYFCNRSSYMYMAALDANKIFKRINRNKLFALLKKRNVPECFINVLIDWYEKLSSCVHWNGVYSDFFKVYCDKCQYGILFPILFNVYVDELISLLKNKKTWLSCWYVLCWLFYECR